MGSGAVQAMTSVSLTRLASIRSRPPCSCRDRRPSRHPFSSTRRRSRPRADRQYWSNPSFDGEPILTRVDPQAAINLGFFNIPVFNATSPKLPSTPGSSTDACPFAGPETLWRRVSGQHELSLTSLGAGTLFVDDEPLIDIPGGGAGGEVVVNTMLTGNRPHSRRSHRSFPTSARSSGPRLSSSSRMSRGH